jgi:D-alanine-D-alanine ligase
VRVGITYDLREEYLAAGFGEEDAAEFDTDATISTIESTLQGFGFATDRIGNVQALARRLVSGDRWDLVFNIAEGIGGFGREAQVPALLDAYRIPYTFSDPLVCALSLHKAMTKRVVRDAGLPTPDFVLVETIDAVPAIALRFPLFAKPVAEGTSKGIGPASIVDNPADLHDLCAHLLRRYGQPVLVERYLPGREFTVGLLGCGASTSCLGVMEVHYRDEAARTIYSYEHKRVDELTFYSRAADPEADAAAELAVAAWRVLGARDAGRVDVRLDEEGRPSFVEANVLPGISLRSDLVICARQSGWTYEDLLGRIVGHALERNALPWPKRAKKSARRQLVLE